ncbi:hypothetical protein [Thalassospira lohafexi]|uniref:Uncharacterized protein n=1 Tax=Thalassospira lohafexi TaxID=744227 RepID=A0A2N3L3Y4_9PROT|nr:hypothetical protein [Thalassospira lohafexi]PKR57518.1 hypothetical protein COO92_16390 [Thalassospira lohafexi]
MGAAPNPRAKDRAGGVFLCAGLCNRGGTKAAALLTAQGFQDFAQPGLRRILAQQRPEIQTARMVAKMVRAIDPAMIIHAGGFPDADISIPIMAHIFFA